MQIALIQLIAVPHEIIVFVTLLAIVYIWVHFDLLFHVYFFNIVAMSYVYKLMIGDIPAGQGTLWMMSTVQDRIS